MLTKDAASKKKYSEEDKVPITDDESNSEFGICTLCKESKNGVWS